MSTTKEQIVEEIHRYARKNYERRKYTMRGIGDTLQADLIDMQQFKRYNRFKYILIVIDVFSKKAYAEPLTDKGAKSVTEAMKKIFNRIGQRIRNLQTDDGKEFFNGTMKRLLEQHNNINHYSSYTTKKASIVERLIRTIKHKLFMQLTLHSTKRWHTFVEKIIDTYNNTR